MIKFVNKLNSMKLSLFGLVNFQRENRIERSFDSKVENFRWFKRSRLYRLSCYFLFNGSLYFLL